MMFSVTIFKTLTRGALFCFALSATAAVAEPITLKLAYFTSDRVPTYSATVKPFVDAVNAAGGDVIKIEVYAGGALSQDFPQYPQLVLDDVADIAFVVPSLTPARFPDTSAMQLPGLFRDSKEATLVFNRLIAANTLHGYDDFFVIGAYSNEPGELHMRTPVKALADLKGKGVATGNPMDAAVLAKLGMQPKVIRLIAVADAISSGSIDGVSVGTTMVTYGISRQTAYHYRLRLAPTPGVLLMNKKKLESLPEPAQAIIRKYSGDWTMARNIEIFAAVTDRQLEQLKADPKHTVIEPSEADLKTVQAAYRAVVNEWRAIDPRNPQLLKEIESEIATLPSTN